MDKKLYKVPASIYLEDLFDDLSSNDNCITQEIIRLKIKVGPLSEAIKQYADFYSWNYIYDLSPDGSEEEIVPACPYTMEMVSLKWRELVPAGLFYSGTTGPLVSCILLKMAALDEIASKIDSWHDDYLSSLPPTPVNEKFKHAVLVQDKIWKYLHYVGDNDIDIILENQVRQLHIYLWEVENSDIYKEDSDEKSRFVDFLLNIYKREQVRKQCNECADRMAIPDEDDYFVTHDFFRKMGPSKRHLLAGIKENLLCKKEPEIPPLDCNHFQDMDTM